MSPQDGSGRTGRVVDFDGLDDEADAGADHTRVVSFDDLGSEPDTDDPRSRVVSFDDLDADAEPGPPRSGMLSFDDLDAAGSRSTTRRARTTGDRTRGGGRTPAGTTRRATGTARGSAPDAFADAGRGMADRDGVTDPADGAGADGARTGARTDDAGTGRAAGRAGQGRRAGRGGRDARERDGGRAGRGGTAAGPSTPQDDESRAREICLRLLTDRARTVKELSDALRRKEIPDDVANRVLERFDEVGLVDDEAFAGQWVRSRHRHKGLGRRAIALELHRKGVDREIADEALSEIDPESEQARARELVDRRLRTMKVATKEDRQSAARRLVGMLARKGYGGGVAYGVVREAIAAKGAEEDELGEAPADD